MRIVHFLNQFFGGLGGEEKANAEVQVFDGPVGPGRALQRSLGDNDEIVATIVSGDNYFNEEKTRAVAAVEKALSTYKPDAVVAGPALNAGRYGLACGEVCVIAQRMGIAAVTGMFPENPGVLEYGRRAYIVPTGETPTEIAKQLDAMAKLALKLARGEEMGPADAEGYIPRGIRKAGLRDEPGAVRAVSMLAARLHGRPYKTELPIEMPEGIEPAAPFVDVTTANVALVTTGGLVPKGNPDRLVRGGAKEYFKYSIAGLDSMTPEKWECVHRGFYTDIVNENPNYILPLNIIRQLEGQGEIGKIYDLYFSTSGVGTTVADSKRLGEEIAREMKEARVDACVMVAT